MNQDIVSGTSITLADTILESAVMYVEVDGKKIDHQNEAGAGELYWAIVGTSLVFSATQTFANVKLAYLKAS